MEQVRLQAEVGLGTQPARSRIFGGLFMESHYYANYTMLGSICMELPVFRIRRCSWVQTGCNVKHGAGFPRMVFVYPDRSPCWKVPGVVLNLAGLTILLVTVPRGFRKYLHLLCAPYVDPTYPHHHSTYSCTSGFGILKTRIPSPPTPSSKTVYCDLHTKPEVGNSLQSSTEAPQDIAILDKADKECLQPLGSHFASPTVDSQNRA